MGSRYYSTGGSEEGSKGIGECRKDIEKRAERKGKEEKKGGEQRREREEGRGEGKGLGLHRTAWANASGHPDP